MSERTKLLKKAVLTGVGASTNADRVQKALNEALEDLIKVVQDLLEDLESKGKVKTESLQNFLRSLKDETRQRKSQFEDKVSATVQSSMKKAAKEIGLATQEELKDIMERINTLEETLTQGDDDGKKSRSTRSRRSSP
ncbi:MAG: hypothetical protein HY711_02600 [Candidatus Melainabacteria bacterium]|nr:hypothetical protein [Candidatus Melainabacteria bacterium]